MSESKSDAPPGSVVVQQPAGDKQQQQRPSGEVHDRRARRRREEAVARLVADATRPPDFLLDEAATSSVHEDGGDHHHHHHGEARLRSQQQCTLLLASTVASSIERGLDRELHSELVRQGSDAQSVISKICHDHSEDFLESVGRVVAALGGPCDEVRAALEEANQELQSRTGAEMLESATRLERFRQSRVRARTLGQMVHACRRVAVLLERARKQAALGRPRAALDAVEEARACLTAPLGSLIRGSGDATDLLSGMTQQAAAGDNSANTEAAVIRLEDTPFGSRAMMMLPKVRYISWTASIEYFHRKLKPSATDRSRERSSWAPGADSTGGSSPSAPAVTVPRRDEPRSAAARRPSPSGRAASDSAERSRATHGGPRTPTT